MKEEKIPGREKWQSKNEREYDTQKRQEQMRRPRQRAECWWIVDGSTVRTTAIDATVINFYYDTLCKCIRPCIQHATFYTHFDFVQTKPDRVSEYSAENYKWGKMKQSKWKYIMIMISETSLVRSTRNVAITLYSCSVISQITPISRVNRFLLVLLRESHPPTCY